MNKEAPEESRIDDPGLLSEKEKNAEEDLPLDEKEFPPEEEDDLPFLFGAKAAGDDGPAEKRVTALRVRDREPYLFRPTGGGADVGSRADDTLVGGTILWNQLVDTGDTSVTVPAGHVYVAALSGTFGTAESDGTALTVDGSGGDMVFDLTRMFGAAVADAVYALETEEPGAGAAWFRSLFPKPYYAYNTGELLSVNASAHKTVGFNLWDEDWERGTINNSGQDASSDYSIRSVGYTQCLPDTRYCFTRPVGVPTYLYWYDAEQTFLNRVSINAANPFWLVTSPSNACFVRIRAGNSVTPVTTYDNDMCLNLPWSGSRNGEYKAHEEHTYPLDSDLTLRGVPKWADGKLCYDGDTYEADGTVTRRYAERAYEEGDESLPDAVTDGTTTVYKLTTPTTETADPFTTPQTVDNWGTEEFVVTEQSGVAVPVGHVTIYSASAKAKSRWMAGLWMLLDEEDE